MVLHAPLERTDYSVWRSYGALCGRSYYPPGYVDPDHLLRTAAARNDERGAVGTWDDWCLQCLALARAATR